MNTRIFLENYELDLTEDVKIPVNLSILDVKNLETRKTEYTKTVRLIGTARNNRIFNYIFDARSQADIVDTNLISLNGLEASLEVSLIPDNMVDGAGTKVLYNFDPRKKVECTIQYHSYEIVRGYLQLLAIEVIDGVVYYDCVVYGALGDVISNMGDKLVSELPEDETINHILSEEGISQSWLFDLPYKYPMVDYGVQNQKAPKFLQVSSLLPAIKLKYYFDKIIEAAGYTYESEFINSDFFNHLYVPYNGDGRIGLDSKALLNLGFSQRLLNATTAGNYESLDTTTHVYEPADFTYGDINFSGNEYIAPINGIYSFAGSQTLNLCVNTESTSFNFIYPRAYKAGVKIVVKNAAGDVVSRDFSSSTIKYTFEEAGTEPLILNNVLSSIEEFVTTIEEVESDTSIVCFAPPNNNFGSDFAVDSSPSALQGFNWEYGDEVIVNGVAHRVMRAKMVDLEKVQLKFFSPIELPEVGEPIVFKSIPKMFYGLTKAVVVEPNVNSTVGSCLININIDNIELQTGDKVYIENVLYKTNRRGDTSVEIPEDWDEGPGFWIPTEEVTVNSETFTVGTAITGEVLLRSAAGSNLRATVLDNIVEDSAVTLPIIALKEVRMRDLFVAVLRMFNMVVVQDEIISKKVLIYTKDEYNSLGKLKDFTNKIDTSRNISIIPITDAEILKYRFSFGESQDYFNQEYKDSTTKLFGEYEIESGNEYGTQTQSITNLFEPVQILRVADVDINNISFYRGDDSTKIRLLNLPDLTTITGVGQTFLHDSVEYEITGVESDQLTIGSHSFSIITLYTDGSILNRYDRDFITIYKSGDGNLTKQRLATKPKLVYYSGMKDCAEYFISGVSHTAYPYFSHLNDNPEGTPTFDLNWGKPRYVNFTIEDSKYPVNNLFTDYYENSVREVVTKNSKLVTAYFNLSPLDIMGLRYNDIIFINGIYYRLNKVIDFDLNSNEPVRLELFQVNELAVNTNQNIAQFAFLENQQLTIANNETGFEITFTE